VCGNIRQLIIHGVGGAVDNRVRETEFSTIAGYNTVQLLDLFRGTIDESKAIISTITSERLIEPIDSKKLGTMAVLEVIYRVVGHTQQHMGQIFVLTKQMYGNQLGLSVPPARELLCVECFAAMDWTIHVWKDSRQLIQFETHRRCRRIFECAIASASRHHRERSTLLARHHNSNRGESTRPPRISWIVGLMQIAAARMASMSGMARHFRPFSWSHFPPRRHGVLECRLNGPTMHFVFFGDTPDASKPVFVFSSKAFVELHSAFNHPSRIRCALTNSCPRYRKVASISHSGKPGRVQTRFSVMTGQGDFRVK